MCHTLTGTIIIHCIFIHTDGTAQQENHRSTLKIWQRRITGKVTFHVVSFEKKEKQGGWVTYVKPEHKPVKKPCWQCLYKATYAQKWGGEFKIEIEENIFEVLTDRDTELIGGGKAREISLPKVIEFIGEEKELTGKRNCS